MGVDAEMFARHSGRLSDKEVRVLAAEMCSRIGPDKFVLWRKREFGVDPHHALSIIPEQDGVPVWEYHDAEPIVGDPEEQFIRVHLRTRYYGKDYERGDWLTIKAVAEFLESRIPGVEIWYGGDSSGAACTHLTSSARREMHRHWIEVGHDPYRDYFDRGSAAVLCEFCGGRRMNETGGGAGATFHWCPGCDAKTVIYEGRRFDLPEDADFFSWRGHVAAAIEQDGARGLDSTRASNEAGGERGLSGGQR